MPKCSFLVFFFLAAFAATPAQMTIFNIPSTDVLPAKGAYIEGDFVTKPVKLSDGGFQTYGVRVVYGVGARTELGANVFYTRDAIGAASEIQVSAKTTIYSDERTSFAWTAGGIGAFPVRDDRGNRPYAFLYSNVSKVVVPLNGLRVTGGVYQVLGGGDDFGTKTGALVGVEQPIKGKFSFVGDWATGHNRFGYVSGGINFQITAKQYLLGGYSWGNSGRGNNYLSVFYGYTF